MAVTTALCTSFKSELLGGIHDLDSHTIKLALIKPSSSGTYDKTTTNYSNVTGNSDETTGTNYSAGGQTLDNISISSEYGTQLINIAQQWHYSILNKKLYLI